MRTRATAAALAVALLIGGGALTSAAAAPPDNRRAASAAAAPRPAARTVTVTLLTGDRVAVTTAADGTRSAVIRPAAGREDVAFLRRTSGERHYVIPSDVAGLVGDRLDPALFDVAGLADAGLAGRGTLPVIVQQAGAARSGSAATLAAESGWAAAGITPERVLSSVGAVSDDVDAAAGAKLLDALRGQARTAGGTSALAAADAPQIAHVWLDAPVHALDADSAPQIGAPRAWESGFTGEGVKVAILDTGIDSTHPDLDGLVISRKDFSGAGSARDGHGHGTHVASIVAGSGEASAGENSGMAPGADLIVGKVLTDEGSGSLSGIIDGMEWATARGADIVNMSLGAPDYTDGTDPLSRAVDRLTAQHDALFVVAAGNDGADESIGTPAAAASALTVGAVNDDDEITDFSSRGPRADGAIKPDVVAPGEEIVAARAAGTTMGTVVGEKYVAASGTSMASPHVAGAAAVLLEARPELTANQLKAVLMGSAESTGATVWAEGAGRVFLPTALAQPVTAEPASLSFGTFEYPHDDRSAKYVTYRNIGADDVVLDLDLAVTDPAGRPATGATLSADRVTVPAGGTAMVKVRVDHEPGRTGRYGGAVVATAADGAVVRTPVGWEKLPQLFDLTVKMIGRDGRPFDGEADLAVMNVNDVRKLLEFDFTSGSRKTFRVPAGKYSVASSMIDSSWTTVVDAFAPELSVTRDRTVTLDARKGMRVSVTTPQVAELAEISLDELRTDRNGYGVSTAVGLGPGMKAFVTPTEPVTVGTFDHLITASLEQPTRRGTAPAYTYDLAFRQAAVRKAAFAPRAEDLARIRATYEDAARDSTVWSGRAPLPDGRQIAWGTMRPTPKGTRTEYVSTRNVRWYHDASYESNDLSEMGFYTGELRAYRPGSLTRTTFAGAPRSPQGVAVQLADLLLVEPSGWSDAAGHAYWSWDEKNETHLTVVQDGETVVDEPAEYAEVTVPEGGAAYQIRYRATPGTSRWYTGKQVTGEWTFRAEPVGEEEFLRYELMDVRYEVAGVDTRGAAPRRTTVAVDVTGADGAAAVNLWWSADGGTTWREAPLTDGVASVKAPAGTTAIALRAEATDAAGNTVKETIRRAYTIE